jgi:formylglycine-generating enzyme required for sulfatase activity
MVWLPGGTLLMGTPEAAIPDLMRTYAVSRRELFAAEAPQHVVTLAPFWIDRFPVTNAQFSAFIDDQPQWAPGRIAPALHNGAYLQHWEGSGVPPALADHPVVFVSWYAALAYARWAGKRLPTEAEWEYAARGGQAEAAFPWGDAPADPSRANYGASGIGATTPVGAYPPNPYGIYDLAGNVWEFCLDAWQADFSAHSSGANPIGGGEALAGDGYLAVTTRRVIRGGSWGGSPVNLRVAYRDSHPPAGAGAHVGFRCARPIGSASPPPTQLPPRAGG